MNHHVYLGRLAFCAWFLALFFIVPWFTVAFLSLSRQTFDFFLKTVISAATVARYQTPVLKKPKKTLLILILTHFSAKVVVSVVAATLGKSVFY